MQEKTVNKVMREMGRRGGKSNVSKHGAARMKEIGRLGGLRKKQNQEKANKDATK